MLTYFDENYVKMDMPLGIDWSLEAFQKEHPELHDKFMDKLTHILIEIFQFSDRDVEGYINLLEMIINTGLMIPRVVTYDYGDDVGIMVWSFSKQKHVPPNMAESLDLSMIDHIFSAMISVN